MEVKVESIKRLKYDINQINKDNIKVIISTSNRGDIESINDENKLILDYDDITNNNARAFNSSFAKRINNFVKEVDFSKQKLYICCDSGVSRSSAIAAAILRKYDQDENVIWKDYNYHPNLLVYKVMCDEFNLTNSKLRLYYKEKINKNALKKKIKSAR